MSTCSRRSSSIPDQKKKPRDSAFIQQNLSAWYPILNVQSASPVLLLISFAFIPIGVVLLLASDEIVEYSADYTTCVSPDGTDCSKLRSNRSLMTVNCTCNIPLNIDKSMKGEVLVYFGLTNFFQNHRRYVLSRYDPQLNGKTVTDYRAFNVCAPYAEANPSNQSSRLIYAPGGAIANSLFNDTFTISSRNSVLKINRTGIAWKSDVDVKFKNPKSWDKTVPPRYWQVPAMNLSNDQSNTGFENEGFIAWMRTAAFSTFRKPYGRIEGGVEPGNYTVTVAYNYPVVSYDGTKRIILSTQSWIGTKNSFLGVMYVVTGSLCLLTAIAFYIIHNIVKKNDPYLAEMNERRNRVLEALNRDEPSDLETN